MSSDADVDGAGTRTGVEANEGMQDRNGGGRGDGVGQRRERVWGWQPEDELRMTTGTGERTETRAVAEIGTGPKDGNGDGGKDGCDEGGGEVKKHKKLHNKCRCHVGNGGDLGGNTKKNVVRKGLVQ